MEQINRRKYLIQYLLDENQQYKDIQIPNDEVEQKSLLRGLLNVRMPQPTSDEFIEIQDAYLQQSIQEMGIQDYQELPPIQKDLYVWQGDISTLKCDAIVNAANSQMLGCFQPNHSCIDNCIHTFAGVQLRRDCAKIMEQQGHEEETGKAKITAAYNLPSQYVIHTVGPIVYGQLTKQHEQLLASCYEECLKIAEENDVHSIAFCCISTGVFMFPNQRAAEIAVETVKKYKERTNSDIQVIFNVFKDQDLKIYQDLLNS